MVNSTRKLVKLKDIQIHFFEVLIKKNFTGDIGKEWLSPESMMMESTLALAGRYSDGGGREDDIPNQILSWVAYSEGYVRIKD